MASAPPSSKRLKTKTATTAVEGHTKEYERRVRKSEKAARWMQRQVKALIEGDGGIDRELMDEEARDLRARMVAELKFDPSTADRDNVDYDPLRNWVLYVDHVRECYPSDSRRQFLLMERCVRAFTSRPFIVPAYQNDVRLVKICILLADKTSNPSDLFKMMSRVEVGTKVSLFWVAWAWEAERAGDFQLAEEILQKALFAGAEPRHELEERARKVSRRKRNWTLQVTEDALFNVDILASIAPYLVATDLTSLGLTCRRFGTRCQEGNGDVDDLSLPLIQEAARRAILEEQSAAERTALVRYPGESWISVYHELLMLRSPLVFDRIEKILEYDGVDKSRVIGDKSRVIVAGKSSYITRSAISNFIMRRGKHYAEFSDVLGYAPSAGIMRPIPSPIPGPLRKLEHFNPAYLPMVVKQAFRQGKNERWGTSNIDCCVYYFQSGRSICCHWETGARSDHDWGWTEGFTYEHAGVLGLLLDLDAGTLTAYKDGRRMGVMYEGLAGEYCWVASIKGTGGISIKRGAIPDDA